MQFCKDLKEKSLNNVNLKQEFADDSNRLEKFSITHEEIFYDFSKTL